MEYGILIVEGEDLMQYQVLGAVNSEAEAWSLIGDYEAVMGPDNDDANISPYLYVIHRRGANGFYTRREEFFNPMRSIGLEVKS